MGVGESGLGATIEIMTATVAACAEDDVLSSEHVPPLIRPGTAMLIRRGDRLQLGCDPDRSLIVELTPPMTAETVAALIRFLAEPRTGAQLAVHLRVAGITVADYQAIRRQLARSEVAPPAAAAPVSGLRLRVHGRGPLADRLTASLAEVGVVPQRSTQRPRSADAADRWAEGQLVILTDYLAHDPAILSLLMRRRIPHLPVRLRDGVAIIGPLVLPGMSSCLRCADRHRATLDSQWPMLAAQLIGKTGYGSAATVRTAVALVHEQIEQITAGCVDSSRALPDLVDHTLEFYPDPVRLRRKYWPAHPSCECGATTTLLRPGKRLQTGPPR